LKKAAQKFLLRWAMGAVADGAHGKHKIKVFLLLFVHKKKPFPLSACAETLPSGMRIFLAGNPHCGVSQKPGRLGVVAGVRFEY
jgi:hypothetical protein